MYLSEAAIRLATGRRRQTSPLDCQASEQSQGLVSGLSRRELLGVYFRPLRSQERRMVTAGGNRRLVVL